MASEGEQQVTGPGRDARPAGRGSCRVRRPAAAAVPSGMRQSHQVVERVRARAQQTHRRVERTFRRVEEAAGGVRAVQRSTAGAVERFLQIKQRELAAHLAAEALHARAAELQERMGHPERAAEARRQTEQARAWYRLAGEELDDYQPGSRWPWTRLARRQRARPSLPAEGRGRPSPDGSGEARDEVADARAADRPDRDADEEPRPQGRGLPRLIASSQGGAYSWGSSRRKRCRCRAQQRSPIRRSRTRSPPRLGVWSTIIRTRATRVMPISHRRSVGAVLSVVSLVTGWSVKSGDVEAQAPAHRSTRVALLDELPPEGPDGEVS
jgi:hypothetical protein